MEKGERFQLQVTPQGLVLQPAGPAPEGGEGGGYVVAEGTPEEVSRIEASRTGQFLKPYFQD